MQVYVRAANNENVDFSYQQAGTFTLYPGASLNFMMSVTPVLRDVAVGSDATYTVNVVPKPGYNDVVMLSANAAVSGSTAGVSPASVTGAGTSTLTVSTSGIPGVFIRPISVADTLRQPPANLPRELSVRPWTSSWRSVRRLFRSAAG